MSAPVVLLRRQRPPEEVPELTRADFAAMYGDVRPTDDLVGPLTSTGSMTPDTSSSTLYLDRAPGQPIRRTRFDRDVRVRFDASPETLGYVLFEDCWFRGQATAPTSDSCLLRFMDASSKGAVVDSLFRPQTPSVKWNGINGHDFRSERNLFERCVDAHGVYNTTATRPYASGVVILAPIARHAYFDAEPNQPDGVAHCDVLAQLQGGQGTVIRGGLVTALRDTLVGDQADRDNDVGQPAYHDGRVLSAILVGNNVGDCSGFVIDRNWIEWGWLPVTAAGAGTSLTSGTITGNRFDGNAGSGRDINLRSTQGAVTTTGNIRYDGGPAVVRRDG